LKAFGRPQHSRSVPTQADLEAEVQMCQRKAMLRRQEEVPKWRKGIMLVEAEEILPEQMEPKGQVVMPHVLHDLILIFFLYPIYHTNPSEPIDQNLIEPTPITITHIPLVHRNYGEVIQYIHRHSATTLNGPLDN